MGSCAAARHIAQKEEVEIFTEANAHPVKCLLPANDSATDLLVN